MALPKVKIIKITTKGPSYAVANMAPKALKMASVMARGCADRRSGDGQLPPFQAQG